jgi:predicted 3-demethylubiquinone-9 3-methyltransferase (glyoxalase superfamily)
MQKITPFLWFDDQAEEAVNLYISLFKNARVVTLVRYGDEAAAASGRPKGSAMTIAFQLEGQNFTALNGGPHFKFTEAISLVVNCTTQAEVDTLWNALCAGGSESQCGWLKDKYGLSWQIVPTALVEMLSSGDAAKTSRMMQAMMQMKKLDIAVLQKAYAQG